MYYTHKEKTYVDYILARILIFVKSLFLDDWLMQLYRTHMENLGKCEKCPIVCRIKDRLTTIEREKQVVTHMATNHLDDVTDFLREAMSDFGDNAIIMKESGETADLGEFANSEEFSRTIRQHTAESLNRLDDEYDEGERLIGGLALLCEGPLAMRARRSGMIITARVCASPDAQNVTDAEPVYVQREPEE
jgi:hypothetical protein